jgi:F-type H+-transporting ATPase subunit b
MLMVSDRTKKILFSLTFIAALVLAASVGFANEGGEGAHHVDKGAQLKDLGWRVLNFVVLLGILGYALKKADVKGSLAARQVQIEKDLKDAQEGKAAAEAKLAEYRSRLEQATKEIDELQAAIIREGEQEKERIIAEAKSAAQKIAAQAARLAVEIATGKLTGAIQKADHDRFVGEYLDKVVQIQ